MTETLLALVPEYGALLLGLATYLSCLAVPLPSSLLMLAAGAFIASGDLAPAPVALAALGGAVAGDQTGYALGRWIGAPLRARLTRRPATAHLVAQAEFRLHAAATPAVFFTRWLFSALGPYVNLLAGAARLPHARFTLAAAGGEAVWVTAYTGAGYLRRPDRGTGAGRLGPGWRACGGAGGAAAGPCAVARPAAGLTMHIDAPPPKPISER